MKKINIFLASSNELGEERIQFEVEIYRKTKKWIDKGIFLHLNVWEDLSAGMAEGGSQKKYNELIREADLFVLLAYFKVGMYTAEEFDHAFGQFQSTQKPFIYTYFKKIAAGEEESLKAFKTQLKTLNHYYSNYTDFNDLWNQFNKELDRLEEGDFKEHFAGKERLLEEKNVVKGDIKRVKKIRIGSKENSDNKYKKENVVEGSVEDADEFILGNGH